MSVDDQPIMGGDVGQTRPASTGDPYQRFAELMEAVEALCPGWPERSTFEGNKFVL